ncbi:MAG TPA: response regulator [Chloroflexota bacterium]|nr:response regulator [Chloroflexota bacterium]
MTRILVIDDEPTICELVADTLRDSGYIVDTAPNGADALERMHRHLPHAIVLDLMMPRLNASGFVERVRLNPRFAAIPILVITASYAAHEAAERLGARACLTKPFELDELVDLVGQMIEESSRRAAANQPGVPTVVPRSFAAET